MLREHGGKGFGAFKEALSALLVEKLRPIAGETQRLLDDPGSVDAVLRDGARAGRGDRRSDRGRGGAAGRVPAGVTRRDHPLEHVPADWNGDSGTTAMGFAVAHEPIAFLGSNQT